MKKLRKTAALLTLTAITLSACAHPQVASPVSDAERNLPCDQIRAEVKHADQLRRDARADDRFRFSYILIVPAVFSIASMNKAEKAAEIRKKELLDMSIQKRCGANY